MAQLPVFFLALCTLVPMTWAQDDFGGLHWRLLGPFRGGRALAVTGVPGAPEKFYFGAVGGGVWVTENAGRTWNPIFDHETSASIGAIAVAPSDPNTIYVGSGEADMRSDIQQGDGMYRSTNAGKTWEHIGLTDSRQIGKILVDPKDPNTVYVAALGHQYGPNAERGVFKSTDGGKTWDKVLYENENVGAIDMAMDPGDSKTIFAALWSTRRPPWSIYPPSSGPGGGLFKTTDAGKTWTQIKGGGFPEFNGRIGVDISRADHNRVYVFADTGNKATGGIYRSDDGGSNWTHTDSEERVWGRGWYFAGITADPKNPDTVYVMNTSAYRSTDGGKSFTAFKGAPGGDDYHTLWIAPDDPNRMIVGSDQGTVVSVDGGKSWSSWYNQPTGQFYHIITDNRFPYWVYGSQQDSGAMGVPSRTIHTGISAMDFRPLDAGGESGTIAPDPLHPGLLMSSTGSKEMFDTGWEQNIDPKRGREEEEWRSEWTMPIANSPANKKVFYTSNQKIFRTSDGGNSWAVISPDLSRETNTVPATLDPATAADIDQKRPGVVYWIAPSPLNEKQVWAGTDDGLIWLTTDDGGHWQNVTPSELTPWSKVGIIDASHFDAGTAYAAIDRHRVDDNHPYIYRTHDFGKHWKLVTDGIPEGQFVNVVREDPIQKGLLYAGTDWNVFVSFDDGDHWRSLQLNLPTASMRDIVFNGPDVIVGTHGRAVWALDDASPLRQRAAVFCKPSPAMLFQHAGTFGFGLFDEGTPFPPEEPQGQNPAWGAYLDYRVARGDGPVVLEVLDSHGTLMSKVSSTDKAPSYDPSKLSIPMYWVKPALMLSSSPGSHRYVWGLRYRETGPLVPPGRYTVRMTIDGTVYTQPLDVVRDPRVPASDADLRAQFEFELKILDLQTRVNAAIGKASGSQLDALKRIARSLQGLEGAVASAPAAPTAEWRKDFEKLLAAATAAGAS